MLSCGQEDPEPFIDCSGGFRFAIEGSFAGEDVSYRSREPIPGRIDVNGFFVPWEEFRTDEGVTVFRGVRFQTHVALDGGVSVLSAIDIRRQTGLDDADTLPVEPRPDGQPCDPRLGVLCAFAGSDETENGLFDSTSEARHRGTSGTITFTEATGNGISGEFEVEFSENIEPLATDNDGDGTGGSLRGCFHLSIDGERLR